jgi:hypothetical protein
MEAQFEHTTHDTIYGVGAIGLHFMVCKMDASGGEPAVVLDWQTNIASDSSYANFETLANLMYNM